MYSVIELGEVVNPDKHVSTPAPKLPAGNTIQIAKGIRRRITLASLDNLSCTCLARENIRARLIEPQAITYILLT